MTIGQMTLVYNHSASTLNARLVLLALADAANDEGEVVFKHSQAELARKANCSVESVRRAIDKLVDAGELAVLAVGTGRHFSRYQITVEPPQNEGPQPERLEGSAPTPAGGQPPHQRGVSPHTSGGSINTSVTAIDHSLPMGATFADFYAAYPKRAKRPFAEKAWAKAIKRADPQLIVDRARAFAANVAMRQLDAQYIPLPASWLNADSWDDDLPAPTPRTKTDLNRRNLVTGMQAESVQDRMRRAHEASQPALTNGDTP